MSTQLLEAGFLLSMAGNILLLIGYFWSRHDWMQAMNFLYDSCELLRIRRNQFIAKLKAVLP